MKNGDAMAVLIGALVAGGVLMLVMRKPGAAAAVPAASASVVKEVFDANGKSFSNGWRYFDDGTTIDPQGNYYLHGQRIWSSPEGYRT